MFIVIVIVVGVGEFPNGEFFPPLSVVFTIHQIKWLRVGNRADQFSVTEHTLPKLQTRVPHDPNLLTRGEGRREPWACVVDIQQMPQDSRRHDRNHSQSDKCFPAWMSIILGSHVRLSITCAMGPQSVSLRSR